MSIFLSGWKDGEKKVYHSLLLVDDEEIENYSFLQVVAYAISPLGLGFPCKILCTELLFFLCDDDDMMMIITLLMML